MFTTHLSSNGSLSENKLEEGKLLLDTIARKHKAIEINISETRDSKPEDGLLFCDAVVRPTEDLVSLHLDIMTSFQNLLTHDNVSADMFYSPPTVAQKSIEWVAHYYDKRGPKDFNPHVTLGEGKAKPIVYPLIFQASRISLCHLGTYCTCKRILGEASLLI